MTLWVIIESYHVSYIDIYKIFIFPIHSHLLELLQVASYWKTEYQLPPELDPLLDKSVSLIRTHNAISLLVSQYNQMVSSLSDQERVLFRLLIKMVDMYMSSILNMEWGSEQAMPEVRILRSTLLAQTVLTNKPVFILFCLIGVIDSSKTCVEINPPVFNRHDKRGVFFFNSKAGRICLYFLQQVEYEYTTLFWYILILFTHT